MGAHRAQGAIDVVVVIIARGVASREDPTSWMPPADASRGFGSQSGRTEKFERRLKAAIANRSRTNKGTRP